jgi:hypothetical protein
MTQGEGREVLGIIFPGDDVLQYGPSTLAEKRWSPRSLVLRLRLPAPSEFDY